MTQRLLIVDDEVELVDHITDYLESFTDEFHVRSANSGEQALEILREGDIDLLLTDVRLPGIDGIEVLRQARQYQPGLRVVVMTAFSSPSLKVEATQAGAIRYVEKPLDLPQLREWLKLFLAEDKGWSGHVMGLDIFDLTNLMMLSGKTKAVAVSFGDQKGVLIFKKGGLVHASAGAFQGEDAFFQMANWDGGTFDDMSETNGDAYPVNIKLASSHLLLEAARLKDEENKVANGGGEQEIVIEEMEIETDIKLDRRPDMENLKEILEGLVSIEGVMSAVVAGRDGFVIEGFHRGGQQHTEAVGAVISTGMGSAEVMGSELLVGNMTQGLYEYSDGVIFTGLIGTEAVLAVVADLNTNLGNIRFQIKKRVPMLEKVLA